LKNNKYLMITEGKIVEYLKKVAFQKSREWYGELGKRQKEEFWRDNGNSIEIRLYRKKRELFTVGSHYFTMWDKTVAAIWWETSIKQYHKSPPLNVLRKLKEEKEKNIFDNFAIVEVKVAKHPIKDPLLIGRIEGNSNRFFIAQWGDDINVDNII